MNNLFPHNIPQLMKLLEDWEYSRLKGRKLSADYYVNQCPELSEQIRLYISMLEEMDWLMQPVSDKMDDEGIKPAYCTHNEIEKEYNECCREFGYHLERPIG